MSVSLSSRGWCDVADVGTVICCKNFHALNFALADNLISSNRRGCIFNMSISQAPSNENWVAIRIVKVFLVCLSAYSNPFILLGLN